VSNICDALALATGEDRYDDAARISMGIGLVGAVGAAVTGLRDYGFIDEDQPSHQVATTHGLGNAVATSLFAASFLLRYRDQKAGQRTGSLARGLALAGGSLALYTAWLGGKLVQEYGEAVKPVMQQRDEAEHESDDENARGRERLASDSPLGAHHG